MAEIPDKVALCVATFYADLAEALEAGAREALVSAGYDGEDQIARFEVPGAFELPMAARYVAESGRYAAIIALGAVIRGETSHYDIVCEETARGLQQVQLHSGVPIGFGVLTVDTHAQALDRVRGGTKRDTGAHAVEAALATLAIRTSLSERPRRAGFSVT